MQILHHEIPCPVCRGIAILTEEDVDVIKNNVTLNVRHIFYSCAGCTNDFTSTETDTITLERVQAAYNELTNTNTNLEIK